MASIARRSRIPLAASILLMALALSACADATKAASGGENTPSGVTLSADRTAYRPGDEVKVVLRNDSEGRVGYNLCFAFLKLQRLESGRWETEKGLYLGPPGETITVCTAEMRLMEGGNTADGTARLPDDLASGTYRLAHDVEFDSELGDRRQVATDGFTVGS